MTKKAFAIILAALCFLMVTIGAVYAADPYTQISFAPDQTDYVSQQSYIEPVKLTLTNVGGSKVSMRNPSDWFIKNVDTGKEINLNYGTRSIQVVVDIKPGEKKTFTWNHKDENGKLVPPGAYAGIVYLFGPNGGAYYESQHFKILPHDIGRKYFSSTPGAGDTKPPVKARGDAPPFITIPSITSLSPNNGPLEGGNQVIIMGSNLSGRYLKINFGSNDFLIPTTDFQDNTRFTVTVPAGQEPGDVDVTVTTDNGKSNAAKYTYDSSTEMSSSTNIISKIISIGERSKVTRITPNKGSVNGGDRVIITGEGFTGATEVNFGSYNAITGSDIHVNKEGTKITVRSPSTEDTGTIDVTVTTPEGTSYISNKDKYTYTN